MTISTPRRYLLLALGLLLLATTRSTMAADPAVRAVLFYSPSCSHCHYVIDEVLTPLVDQYGDQLQIVGINISEPGGRTIYENTIVQLPIPETRTGVPTLIVGETVLVGSGEIPEQFPAMVESILAAGGNEWPAVPGLPELLAQSGLDDPAPEATAVAAVPVEAAVPALAATATGGETMWDRAARDPLGNGLSIALLLGMVVAWVYAIVRLWRVGLAGLTYDGWPGWKAWGVAALCVVGLGVSAYMAYVETTQTAAVCGPVGDCNTVQQSEYASLFGVLPIGILGLVGYGLLLLSWAGIRWGRGSVRRLATWALPGLALAGTLFSIYLTFLEPFVIGATCAWCLTSAAVMTLILLLSLPPGAPAAQPVRRAQAGA
jgi:uncharacterized membrane protein